MDRDPTRHWDEIRQLFRRSFRSSFHYAIASVAADGTPRVTPIGSLILREPGRGFYFERFTQGLARNLDGDRRVCVLAVDSGLWFWLRSLVAGRFAQIPAVRLYGVAGEPRPATPEEIALWRRRVGRTRFTRGYARMWRDMNSVREIEFTRIEPVSIGRMTQGLWHGVPDVDVAGSG